MARSPGSGGVRLAELLGVMSLGVDLGMGQPMEHVLRQCLISLRLADRAGLDSAGQRVVYYTSLLAWVGCHVDAYEQAKWFGDDMALKADFRRIDAATPSVQRLFMLRRLGAGESAFHRAGVGISFVRDGGARAAAEMLHNHYRAAEELASRLGLEPPVRTSIEQTFERWDGKGVPHGARGADILTTSQLVNLADVVEVYHRAGGVAAAVAVARERRGTQFAPDLVDLFCDEADVLFRDLDASPSWDAVIDAEPGPGLRLSEAEFEAALEAIADFVDLKSPFTIGHSRAVAALSAAAARHHGLSDETTRTVRRAALVHDLGRLGIPNSIWDKPGELTEVEAERVRMHPYLGERMLAFSPTLAPLGAVAGQHHERLDGSGYPRGLGAEGLSVPGRILATADAYHTWCERRPHRPAITTREAASRLKSGARSGRFDGAVVDAVLKAAGHHVSARTTWPAGLTAREVQVLRLVARGLSNKEIAAELVISRKTAGRHIEHIYAKTGASNRAMASIFAARHGLMSDVLPAAD